MTLDQPSGDALLQQARHVLLNDLLPLLPRERAYEARMAAAAMATAAREMTQGGQARARIAQAITDFYRRAGLPNADAANESTLARDIRGKAIGARHEPALRELLETLVRERLAISNPKYLSA
jgi:hypothetical protein